MKDPNLLLSVLSLVWIITVGLFVYIIKIKDKSEENTKQALDEIKILIGSVNLNLATIKQDLENNIYTTRGISTRVEKHNEQIHSVELKVNTLMENKQGVERRLLLIERQVTELKK